MDLVEAVAATYAVVGQDMTDLGLRAVVEELRRYPPGQVMTALTRCRRELKKITLSDILDRLPSGHPGGEEAWALVAPLLQDEGPSVVWTEEIAEAFGVARALAQDPVAARMAFKEAYQRRVTEARAQDQPAKWRVSLGWSPEGREQVIQEAVAKGRLSIEYAQRLLPSWEPSRDLMIR